MKKHVQKKVGWAEIISAFTLIALTIFHFDDSTSEEFSRMDNKLATIDERFDSLHQEIGDLKGVVGELKGYVQKVGSSSE